MFFLQFFCGNCTETGFDSNLAFDFYPCLRQEAAVKKIKKDLTGIDRGYISLLYKCAKFRRTILGTSNMRCNFFAAMSLCNLPISEMFV